MAAQMKKFLILAYLLYEHAYSWDLRFGDEYSKYAYFELLDTTSESPESSTHPVTFLTSSSYAELKGYAGMSSMNISLSFRTYEENGMVIYHNFTSPGHVKMFLEKGKLKVEIETRTSPKIILDNFNETFNDGHWHQVALTISKNSLVLKVDDRPTKSTRQMEISTGYPNYIGGIPGNHRGFIGCMRLIQIDGNDKLPVEWKEDEYCCDSEIVLDACQMVDRCNPNPCKHSATCKQTSNDFSCDCAHTGYSGAVCQTSLNPLGCEDYRKSPNSITYRKVEVTIDVDGSGPLGPFPVTCEFFADGRVRTILHHGNEHATSVDGFEEPASFVQVIKYDANLGQIDALISRSHSCRQRISYSCKHSKLFNTPLGQAETFRPNAYWVNRWRQGMDYWGGAVPGSRKCQCGMTGSCVVKDKWCNCDADLEGWLEDSGDITEKRHLPVLQVHFGDTGSALDHKEGRYTLGPLSCEGDDFLTNGVTFRRDDATIQLPTFNMGYSGDIYFEFKTSRLDGVIMHSKGPGPNNDYIMISMWDGSRFRFEYRAGGNRLAVSVQTPSRLTDNNWHSVSVERNRKEARIVIDGVFKSEVAEPPGPVLGLFLTSDLVVGATVDYRHGYIGCIRSLLLSGELQDLRSYARRGLYGVSEDCVGRCESNPCLNNGTCLERYSGYWCDCSCTAFEGLICANEIGVNLPQNSMIKYDFDGTWRSTIAEKIRVGFTTTSPKGFLLGFSSNISGEYMTILVSNSGHLRVVFDFGFERQEIIYPDKRFDSGQYHDVRISRKNSGGTLVIQVDDNEPKEFQFSIKASADAQFNNIQYMYIGKNESMHEGFTGCVSRVEFDHIYPLKLLFYKYGPNNVYSSGAHLSQDSCGVKPITYPPNIMETRPPPHAAEDKVRAAYNEVDSTILEIVIMFLAISLIVMCRLSYKHMSRRKAEYLMQEDKGAETAFDADSAVVNSATEHQVQKRK